jgi:hypothetical protein
MGYYDYFSTIDRAHQQQREAHKRDREAYADLERMKQSGIALKERMHQRSMENLYSFPRFQQFSEADNESSSSYLHFGSCSSGSLDKDSGGGAFKFWVAIGAIALFMKYVVSWIEGVHSIQSFFVSQELPLPLTNWVLGAVLLVIYLLPSLIIYARSHSNTEGFVIVNILFGWTVIAWITILVYALFHTQPVPQEKDKEDHKSDPPLATIIPTDKDSSSATTLHFNPWTQTWK